MQEGDVGVLAVLAPLPQLADEVGNELVQTHFRVLLPEFGLGLLGGPPRCRDWF